MATKGEDNKSFPVVETTTDILQFRLFERFYADINNNLRNELQTLY